MCETSPPQGAAAYPRKTADGLGVGRNRNSIIGSTRDNTSGTSNSYIVYRGTPDSNGLCCEVSSYENSGQRSRLKPVNYHSNKLSKQQQNRQSYSGKFQPQRIQSYYMLPRSKGPKQMWIASKVQSNRNQMITTNGLLSSTINEENPSNFSQIDNIPQRIQAVNDATVMPADVKIDWCVDYKEDDQQQQILAQVDTENPHSFGQQNNPVHYQRIPVHSYGNSNFLYQDYFGFPHAPAVYQQTNITQPLQGIHQQMHHQPSMPTQRLNLMNQDDRRRHHNIQSYFPPCPVYPIQCVPNHDFYAAHQYSVSLPPRDQKPCQLIDYGEDEYKIAGDFLNERYTQSGNANIQYNEKTSLYSNVPTESECPAVYCYNTEMGTFSHGKVSQGMSIKLKFFIASKWLSMASRTFLQIDDSNVNSNSKVRGRSAGATLIGYLDDEDAKICQSAAFFYKRTMGRAL